MRAALVSAAGACTCPGELYLDVDADALVWDPDAECFTTNEKRGAGALDLRQERNNKQQQKEGKKGKKGKKGKRTERKE